MTPSFTLPSKPAASPSYPGDSGRASSWTEPAKPMYPTDEGRESSWTEVGRPAYPAIAQPLDRPLSAKEAEIMASLSEEQRHVVEMVRQGKSIFFTGCAGTGKSYLLKAIVAVLNKDTTHVTALTGVAALNIGGKTLHSFAGIGLVRSIGMQTRGGEGRGRGRGGQTDLMPPVLGCGVLSVPPCAQYRARSLKNSWSRSSAARAVSGGSDAMPSSSTRFR